MYKLINDDFGNNIGVKLTVSNNNVKSIPFDPANTDYQEYLQWLDDGNTPEEAE